MADVFVFGSNLAGVHGAGSAKHALIHHGALYGQGHGRQGNSYAIPTKDEQLNVLPLDSIKMAVDNFLMHAKANPQDTFNVVAIGCGLAGYQPSEIAPMFDGSPDNVNLPEEFTEWQHGHQKT